MAHRSARVAIVGSRVLISRTSSRHRVHHFGARTLCKRTTHERRAATLALPAVALSDSILELNYSGPARGPEERLLQCAFAFSTGAVRQ